MTEPYSRRQFLRLAAAVPVGLAVGVGAGPAMRSMNENVENNLGIETGNAGFEQVMQQACPVGSASDCLDEFATKPSTVVGGTVVRPIVEEVMWRTIPSMALDADQVFKGHKTVADVGREALWGTGGYKLSKRECIVGAATSVLFGLSHNVTPTGVSTRTMPAEQTIMGAVCWILQRKFGVGANSSAHAIYNYRWLQRLRS